MRTKNFFKGLAVAAVALVGVFATSCSEEELAINGKIEGSEVTQPTPTPLPAGVAYAAISVVDMGDLGVASKVLYTEVKDVTALNGTEIECPDFDGMEDYVIPAAQTINFPALSDGQTVTIPVTFYVVDKESAFAAVKWTYGAPEDEGLNEGVPFETAEVKKGSETEALQNLSNYWKDITVKYSVPTVHFTKVLGEEAPEEGGEDEGTEEGGEDEGTEEGGEDEGTEEGGEEAEGTSIYSVDYSELDAYPFFDLGAPEGSSFKVENGVLVIENTVEGANMWDLQPMIADQFSLQEGYNYTVKITMKASADGSVQLALGGWDAGNMYAQLNFTASEEFTTYDVLFASSTVVSANNDIHVLWQGAKFVGTVEIAKVEIIEAVGSKAAATTAEEIIDAFVQNMVMPEYGVAGVKEQKLSNTVCVYSGGCVDFTKIIESAKPTYKFTYGDESKSVQFEQILSAKGELSKAYAIPGHESEFEHSHGHGHYGHGDNSNAGGGIVTFE